MSPKCCGKFGFDLEQATVICCILEFFFAYVHVLVACFVVLLAPMKYIEILTKSCYGYDTLLTQEEANAMTKEERTDFSDCLWAYGDTNITERFPRKLSILQWIFFAVYVIYFVGLLIQAAFSIPLYLIGYKKRNPKIITAWIIIAAINYICPGILFFGSFAEVDLGGAYSPPTIQLTGDEAKEYAKTFNRWLTLPGGIPKLTGFLLIYMFYLDFPIQVFWAYRKSLMQGGGYIAPAAVPQQAMETQGMQPEASEVQVVSADLAGDGEAASEENV